MDALGDPGDIAELGVHRARAQDGARDAGARELGVSASEKERTNAFVAE